MDKIKSNIHKGNKHFVLGLSFVVFSLIISIYWGLTYAAIGDPVLTIPSSPSNLVGNVQNNLVTLSWVDNASNEDKFNVSRKSSGGTSWASIVLLTGSDITSYTDNTVTAGNTYEYQVEACLSGTGCSTPSPSLVVVVPSSITAPSAPTNLRVSETTSTASSTTVLISWNNNSNNQDRIIVERRLSTESSWQTLNQITTAGVSTYADNTVTPGNSYYYQIEACLVDLCSSSGPSAVFYVPTYTATSNAPAVPANFRQVTSTTAATVSLAWTNGTIAQDSIKIQKKQTGTSTWIDIPVISGTISSYMDTAVTVGVYYDYQIRACLSGVCSSYSSPLQNITASTTAGGTNYTVPPAPTNFRVSTTTIVGAISLLWTNGTTAQDSLKIQRRVSGDTTNVWTDLVVPTGGTLSYFSDYSVTEGVVYDYRIQACMTGLCSSYAVLSSIPVPSFTGTSNTTIPIAPTGFDTYTTLTSSMTVIPLKWIDNSSNESSFVIERKLSSSTIYTVISSVNSNITLYTDSAVVKETSYDYRIKACSTTGVCSDYVYLLAKIIPAATVTTPAAPTGFSVYTTLTSTMSSIPLKWVYASSSGIFFMIERKLSSSSTYSSLSTTGVNVLSYTDSSGITKGTFYDYRIKACSTTTICSPYVNLSGIMIPSATTSTTSTCTSLTLNLNDNKTSYTIGDTVNYTWTCSPGTATNVSIKLLKPDGTLTNYNSGSGSNTQTLGFSTSNLVSGSYVLKACFDTNCASGTVMANKSFNLVSATTTTPAPTGLRLSTTSIINAISLLWTNGSTLQSQINIERKLSSSTTWQALTQILSSTISSYVDKAVTVGVPYDYRIKACYANLCSAYTVLEKIYAFTSTNTTDTTLVIPKAPSNLSLASSLTSNSKYVALKWIDNATNEDKFNIERKLSSGGVWNSLSQITGSNLSFYTDTTIVPGNTYDYRVQACLSGAGCSSYSILEKVYVPIYTSTDLTNTATDSSIVATPIVATPITTTSNTTVTTSVNIVATNPTPVVDSSSASSETTSLLPEKKEITPVVVVTPKEVIDNVTQILNIIPVSTEIKTETNQIEINKEEQIRKEEVVKLVYQDTNSDGISDYDSTYIYNIDPIKPSPVSTYEGRDITAGEKILLGFDPAKTELAKVTLEEPTLNQPQVVATSYKVKEIKLTENKGITLKGQALPNSFITVYIYSTPIMVTVRTDNNGEWQYTLDKELDNGDHTVYTASVNNTGKIVAKSTPYNFVKTAEAVTLRDVTSNIIPAPQAEKPGFLQTKNIFIISVASLLMIGITLILIGLFTKKNTQIQ